MRRLNFKSEAEHGATSVIVALLLVTLLGFTAIAVDVGMLYSEKAQLQNGADAAALLVAQKCAKDTADADCSSSSALAATMASSNALDGQSNLKSLAVDKVNLVASVTVGAQEQGKEPNKVTLFFARIFGLNTTEVNASSTVKWGTPSKGAMILPLAIAQCKLNLQPGAAFATEQTINLDFSGCAGVPGGFSWIATGSTCGVTLTAGQASDPGVWFSSKTGASVPGSCTATDLSQMNDKTVLLPLYDVATGNGSSGKYYVQGFAAFHVTAYHFPGNSWTTGGSIPNKSIRGYFVRFVSLSQALELGNAPDYGTAVVRLTQ